MSHDTCRTDDAPGTTERQEDGRFSRRRLVATGAVTWASLSLSGCAENDEPTDDGTDSPGGGTITVTSTTTTTDDPGSSPGGTDTPSGSTPTPTVATTTSCDKAAMFMQGQEIGVIVGVFRSRTAENLGPGNVDSVTLQFPHDDVGSKDLTWEGGHDRVVDYKWGTTLPDTEEMDPGSYQYEVVVETAEGEQATVTDSFGLLGDD